MVILGLNAYHADSSAALFVDGRLIAAVEEERFRRIKHWAGLPTESVRYCLNEGVIMLSDVDALAINTDKKAALGRKLKYLASGQAKLNLVKEKLAVRKKRKSVAEELSESIRCSFAGRSIPVEHHMAHLASGFYVSPFDDAVVASIDGFGDFSSSAWGRGEGQAIDINRRIYFPHSLGIFYQAMTQFLGFARYGDEYKVMGLASYGRPEFENEVSDVISILEDGGFELNLKYFRHYRDKVGFEWGDSEPVLNDLFSPELEGLLGKRRKPGSDVSESHRNIAASVQLVYEKAFFNLLKHARRQVGSDNLALSGGCAMNSVANGKIYNNTGLKRVFVQPAAGDAGGAIGAALVASAELGGNVRVSTMDHAYWGPRFDNDNVIKELEASRSILEEENCRAEYLSEEDVLLSKTVQAIMQGKVVGWFSGRMEWGPRALGSRSILCDPRRLDMKDILNSKIKRRESFRPFAPSILRDAVADWFETDDDVPFMCKVFVIKSDRQKLIPAVTHIDGTGRLQTIKREHNPRYYGLIERFGEETGVPILLNTSFNENEPIVCQPAEALDCFIRTKMDVLVLENYFLFRL